MSTLLDMASATHPGRVRTHNEDCVAFDAAAGFALLADGMGGHNAGEIASSMAVARVRSEITQHRGAAVADSTCAESLIAQHVGAANAAVFNAALSDPALQGMGTTLVVVLWQGRRMSVGHVGDSRLYRLRERSLEQLTRDHSLVQAQIDSGAISRELARHAVNRNVLTRAVGIGSEVAVEVHSYRVERGDLYLLCSDGLSEMLADAQIRDALVSSRADIGLAAQRLVDEANAGGGRDNVSVVLARVTGVGHEGGE